jgi:hypothetical protein
MSTKRELAIEKSPGPYAARAEIREMQELWFVLARSDWTSIVLAPAHPDGSAEDIARSLADVGKHLSDYPVTAITVKLLGPGSARALAALAQHVQRDRERRTFRPRVVDVNESAADIDGSMNEDGNVIAPAGQLIVAIPPVVVEPLGLAVAQAADKVVLTIDAGRTRMADARRSVELIGRERIAGCFLVRNGRS